MTLASKGPCAAITPSGNAFDGIPRPRGGARGAAPGRDKEPTGSATGADPFKNSRTLPGTLPKVNPPFPAAPNAGHFNPLRPFSAVLA